MKIFEDWFIRMHKCIDAERQYFEKITYPKGLWKNRKYLSRKGHISSLNVSLLPFYTFRIEIKVSIKFMLFIPNMYVNYRYSVDLLTFV